MNIKLDTWCFGKNNDKLIKLVLNGKKTATTYIDNGYYDNIGHESVLIYDNKKYACITKTKEIIITEFKNIGWNLAMLEGENNSLKEWQEEHINYFKSIDKKFNNDTKVVFEIFEVIKKFD